MHSPNDNIADAGRGSANAETEMGLVAIRSRLVLLQNTFIRMYMDFEYGSGIGLWVRKSVLGAVVKADRAKIRRSRSY